MLLNTTFITHLPACRACKSVVAYLNRESELKLRAYENDENQRKARVRQSRKTQSARDAENSKSRLTTFRNHEQLSSSQQPPKRG